MMQEEYGDDNHNDGGINNDADNNDDVVIDGRSEAEQDNSNFVEMEYIFHNNDGSCWRDVVGGSRPFRLVIDPSVTTIPNCVFQYSENLVKIVFPALACQAKRIGASAFKKCKNLHRIINFPSSIRFVYSFGFSNCHNLRRIDLPSEGQLVHLGYSSFYGCSSLHKIFIPKRVQNVGFVSFKGCTSLKRALFHPELSINKIVWSVFTNCTQLDTIKLPQNLLSYQ